MGAPASLIVHLSIIRYTSADLRHRLVLSGALHQSLNAITVTVCVSSSSVHLFIQRFMWDYEMTTRHFLSTRGLFSSIIPESTWFFYDVVGHSPSHWDSSLFSTPVVRKSLSYRQAWTWTCLPRMYAVQLNNIVVEPVRACHAVDAWIRLDRMAHSRGCF
jgi:hypothetical protein